MLVEAASRVAAGVVVLLREGHFDLLADRFAPELRAIASPDTLRAAWAAELQRHGPVTRVGRPESVEAAPSSPVGRSSPAEPSSVGGPGPVGGTGPDRRAQGGELVRLRTSVECARGGFTVVMSVDGAGLVHGLRLAPGTDAGWHPPRYAVRRRFTEREVTLGTGPHSVPGTLTLPRRRGRGPAGGRGRRPGPAVVLLAGGGPVDRDGTFGVNKPLKDLAWGLASRGVTVARFDKPSLVHPDVAHAPDWTMTTEYVPPALAAVRALRNEPTVDSARVFVLGHSMGGRVAPRVVAADPTIAGLVLLAADAEPMQRAAVRVARRLAALRPGPNTEAAVSAIARQAARVESPTLGPDTPAAELPFGLPAGYWLDLRDDDPPRRAAALDRPMLILQGGRDYQVTAVDDLTRWRTALGHRTDVTIRVHPRDDHLFFPGDEPSEPAGYDPPQHVDPLVIADVAAWLVAGETAPGTVGFRLGLPWPRIF